MPLFIYKAMDAKGAMVNGQLDAVNAADLEARLQRLGLDLIKGRQTDRKGLTFRSRKVKRIELITFCFHLEQMIRAGVPMLEGLADLRDSIDNLYFREVVADMIENIQGGMQLSQALARHPKIFSKVFQSLIRAGEHTGNLPDIFKQLTETLKWQDELAAHTKKILMYPAFVGTVVIGVTFFLMIYLVPQLVKFMTNMGQELPFYTKALIFVSGIFVDYWYLMLILPPLTIFSIYFYAKRSTAFQYKLDNAKLKVWLIGPILRKIILARFANLFALMYASGITILECITISEEIVGNKVITEALRKIGVQISEGTSVTESFSNVGLFPPLVIRMIKVGEGTGALDTSLRNVSYFYDREVTDSIGQVQSLIEPAMTVILGVLLGWIMLSVLGPIYDTISKLKI